MPEFHAKKYIRSNGAMITLRLCSFAFLRETALSVKEKLSLQDAHPGLAV